MLTELTLCTSRFFIMSESRLTVSTTVVSPVLRNFVKYKPTSQYLLIVHTRAFKNSWWDDGQSGDTFACLLNC